MRQAGRLCRPDLQWSRRRRCQLPRCLRRRLGCLLPHRRLAGPVGRGRLRRLRRPGRRWLPDLGTVASVLRRRLSAAAARTAESGHRHAALESLRKPRRTEDQGAPLQERPLQKERQVRGEEDPEEAELPQEEVAAEEIRPPEGRQEVSVARPSIRLAAGLGAMLVSILLLIVPAAADAAFGFVPGEAGFKATATSSAGGEAATLAGSHPYSLVTEVQLNKAGEFSDGDLKDLTYDLPPGLIENPIAIPRCGVEQFATPRVSPYETTFSGESCSGTTQIGIITLESSHAGGESRTFGVFNLAPPPGAPSRFGFSPYGEPITITPQVREAGREYGLTLDLRNFSQKLDVTGFRLVIWGVPWATAHDEQRGNCLKETEPAVGNGSCPVSELNPPHVTRAYLTLPSSCETPLDFHIRATSWQQPTVAERSWNSGGALTECGKLSFNPVPSGRLSTNRTSSPSGYDFTLDGSSSALLNPNSRASSQAKKAVVRLPDGMSVNPSVASGLGTCSEARFAAETVTSAPGAGCPNDSKV